MTAGGMSMSRPPLFLCGASRSGTAMLRQVLNRSPQVHIAGETHYFEDLRTRLGPAARRRLTQAEARVVSDYFLALAHRPYGHHGDPARSRLAPDLLARRAVALGETGDDWFEAFCRLHAVVEGAEEAHRWGEKTPRHVFRLGAILERYPQAQAIVLVRDPRAVVASYRDWENQGGLDLDDGYTQALADEQARTRASYDPTVAALAWRASVRAACEARRRFGTDRVWVQRYEDVVRRPRETVRALCTWAGLEFLPEMLEIPVLNSSVAAFDPGGGISEEAVDRWRQRLDATETAIVQLWCRREMTRFAYEPVPVAIGPADSARAALRAVGSAVRAVRANRDRAGGSLVGYVARRARLVLARR